MRALALVLAAACATPALDPGADVAPSADATAPKVIRLAKLLAQAELDLPASNLPPGRVAGAVPLREAFVAGPAEGGVATWTTSLPPGIAPDAAGLALVGPGGTLPRADEPRVGTWTLRDGRLVVRTPKGAAAPATRGLRLRADALVAEEGRLSLAASGLDPVAFASGRITAADGVAEGVYLPAPGSATFTVDVPLGAVFDAEVRLVPPPVAGSGSDGATFVLEVLRERGPVELGRVLATREGARLHVPLDAAAGTGIRLRLRSDPGATRFHDYLQVVDPTVYVPQPTARRVVLVQVAALTADEVPDGRPGGLGSLPASSVRFTSAWTTAPWSLPATRAVLAGDQPERAAERPTLAERLGAAGFATAALLDDPQLLGPDGVTRGWTSAQGTAGLPAADVAARAEAWLGAHDGRDALLLVELGDLERALVPAGPTAGEPWAVAPASPAPARADVLAAVGAAVDRIVAAAGPSAWVVAYADHGVVFQGGKARHADVLADAVVRVPLVVRVPGAPAARRDLPVSLLDLAPTVLQVVGQAPPADIAGRSLLGQLSEPPAAPGALLGRPLAFGRARGDEHAWGVVDHGVVWRVGDPMPPGTHPDQRLDEAVGAGVRKVDAPVAPPVTSPE